MNTTTKTPVNSIVIPERFVNLCGQWHGSMGDLLYAVASTGNLTTGDRRPMGCDSEEEWYLVLWERLTNDVGHAAHCAKRGHNAADLGGDGSGHDRDYPLLVEFETYADEITKRLSTEYGLDEWVADEA